ncbi:hypothetical protein DFJ73DRAFT_765498 [Zopfochytrium polystomum]|nr:hypothetical protein DFJ73DRAFT_765498 [Zopfochytrium polystomum]
MVDTPTSLPDWPVNTLAEVAQLNDMQWACFFNDMGTPIPEEIALSSVYSMTGNNEFSDIFEKSASSPVTPTAAAATVNTDKDTLESALILAEEVGLLVALFPAC